MKGKHGCCFVIALMIGVSVDARISHAESLYVFYPTVMRAKVVQQKLSIALPGVKTVVLSRYRDFKKKVQEAQPDAILAKQPVVESIAGYSIKLRGVRNGATEEGYALLAVDTSLDPNNISQMMLGVLDLLGRKGMVKFIDDHFSAKPKLKRVTKIEDLLPLLTFNMAEGILIPKSHVDYFTDISKLNFVAVPIPQVTIGIAAVATKQGSRPELILKTLQNIDKATEALLEVNSWIQK